MEFTDAKVINSNDIDDIVARFEEDGYNVDRCRVDTMLQLEEYKPSIDYNSTFFFGWRDRRYRS